jgi:hypothetical protein
MAVRSLVALAVVIALQALAGCERSAKSGMARDEPSAWRQAEFASQEARLRWQVEAGTLGLAQLFPDGRPIDPRHLRPLPPPSAVRKPMVGEIVAQSGMSDAPVKASPGTAGQPGACVYKPVMTEADIEACR